MKILTTVDELRRWRAGQNGTVGLVPTMGALHAGHISLVRRAAEECAAVVTTLFVNPTQFGPNEDFARYPRAFEADCALLDAEAARHPQAEFALFAPASEEIYPRGASTFVEVAALDARLDGGSRPGHFRGVATVVAKLLCAAQANRAYFGQKDAAQCALIRRLVADLLIPTEIVVCPIVREPDGLALSSRNRYLNVEQRQQALVLYRALSKIEKLFRAGETCAATLREAALSVFAVQPAVRVDFVAIVDWATLDAVARAEKGTLCAVAAYVSETRLIDNVVLE